MTFRHPFLKLSVFMLMLPAALFAQGQPPANVVTALVREGAFSQPIRLTGTVEPFRRTMIGSEVEGVVSQLHVDEGDHVTSGTPLMVLRQRPLQLAAKAAEAQMKRTAEELRELRNGSRDEDVAIEKASWEEWKTRSELAKAEYDRYTELLADKSVSESEFESVKREWETAKASEEVAKARYERVKSGARIEVIAAAEASHLQAVAQYELAKDILDRSTIRAPYDGIVTQKYIDVGSWVSEGDTVLGFQSIDEVKVTVAVPENYFSSIKLGDLFDVTFDAAPQKPFVGKVSQRIARADPQTRSFPIKILIDNEEELLAPGMLARLSIEKRDESEKSVIIPKDALVPMYPNPVVYRIDKGDKENMVANQVEVTTGRFFGEAVEVYGDLRPGQQIVIRGNERLQPGQAVVLNTFMTNQNEEAIDPSRFFEEDRLKENSGG